MTKQEIKYKMRLTLWQRFLVWAMKKMFRLCEKNKLELCVDDDYFTLGFLNTRNISEHFYGEDNLQNLTYEVGNYIEDINEPYVHDRYACADFKEHLLTN